MRNFTQDDPLTDAELDRLGDFLKSCKGGRAMNVEQLDGFFAALITGPETVMPSEPRDLHGDGVGSVVPLLMSHAFSAKVDSTRT